MNPDTEQVGYHAQRVTKEQQARAEALVRAMCVDPDPVLQALGLAEPRTAVRQTAGPPPPPPPPGVEACKNGHPRTEANTRWRMKNGYRCRDCLDCEKAWQQGQRLTPTWNPDTHCRNGHERTEANTYTSADGRRCQECRRNAARAARERRGQGR